MFTLYDTFNAHEISRHRTLDAAARAQVKHARDVRRRNGQNSYIPTKVLGPNGDEVDNEVMARANYRAT